MGTPLNLDLLTKSILKLSLSPNQNQLMSLRGEVLDMPEFYLVAAEGTAQSDWESWRIQMLYRPGQEP